MGAELKWDTEIRDRRANSNFVELAMPQLQLPIFQEGTHLITENLGYLRKDGQISYLHGMMPVFIHDVEDTASFKMIASQFYLNGNAKQSEIVKAFGINPLALKRWVKKYLEDGPRAFYIEKRDRPRAKKKPNRARANFYFRTNQRLPLAVARASAAVKMRLPR